jgi:transposase-like protein
MATNASNSRWTPELRLQVEKLAAQGLRMREIGAQVGMTKNQIIGWLNRNYYDGPTMEDRLDALHAKMDEALNYAASHILFVEGAAK